MHPFIPLTVAQHNVLTGLMLGDGHLKKGKSNINAALMVGRSVRDEDYLRYEMSIFANFLPPRHHNQQMQYSLPIAKRSGLTRSDCCYFSTVNSPSFTFYHTLWYQSIDDKFVKRVPNSLQLNGQIVAHWIADDGGVDYNKLPYRLRCEFSTHGFLQEEVEFLAELLKDRYQEDFLVCPKHRKDKTYYTIKCYDSACRTMFLDIDSFFKMDRKRIWDHPESRFWQDPPERQREMVKIFQKRKNMLDQMIIVGKPFTLKELATNLSYIYDGKIEYKAVNKILQPYLEGGIIIKEMDYFDNNTITIRVLK
jgi:hypothetical protein